MTKVIGRYSMHGVIASGGMASVHFGRLLGPAGFTRTVAIKRLLPTYARDAHFVTMFLDEARLASRVQHPNVVPVIDVVATGDELFLVMEYVNGEALSRILRHVHESNQRIPPAVAVAIVHDALEGLHAAHEAKNERGEPLDIVHRDVSPQNILVGTDGIARVLDFGIAKAAGRAQNTREGQLKGKLAYMSPEQLHGKVSRGTDVFAASIVLWEALTSRRLFAGDNEGETVNKILNDDIVPPSRFAPAVPAALDAVVLCGLSRDLENRYPTARAMAAALSTCPKAEPQDVAEWLDSIAKDLIDERAGRVAEAESQPETLTFAPTSTTTIASKAPVRRRAALSVLVALASLGVIALVARAWIAPSRVAQVPPLAPPSGAPPAPIASEPTAAIASAPLASSAASSITKLAAQPSPRHTAPAIPSVRPSSSRNLGDLVEAPPY